MKKFFLVMLAAIAALSIGAEPYAMMVGSNKIALEENGTSEFCNGDCHEYKALNVALNQGDLITFYDEGQGAGWAITNIERYGAYQNFSSASDGITCNVAGTYDFYFKLEFGNDRVYIEAKSGQGGTPGGGEAGSLVGWFYKGYIDGADVEPSLATKFYGGQADFACSAQSYLMVIYQEDGAQGVEYMATAYVDETNTCATLVKDCHVEKWAIPAGMYTLYLYQGDNANEVILSREVIAGRTLVDTGSALDEVAVKVPAKKIVRNGQILIQVDDKLFNALGAEMK